MAPKRNLTITPAETCRYILFAKRAFSSLVILFIFAKQYLHTSYIKIFFFKQYIFGRTPWASGCRVWVWVCFGTRGHEFTRVADKASFRVGSVARSGLELLKPLDQSDNYR